MKIFFKKNENFTYYLPGRDDIEYVRNKTYIK